MHPGGYLIRMSDNPTSRRTAKATRPELSNLRLRTPDLIPHAQTFSMETFVSRIELDKIATGCSHSKKQVFFHPVIDLPDHLSENEVIELINDLSCKGL
jgi:hypothetical protein